MNIVIETKGKLLLCLKGEAKEILSPHLEDIEKDSRGKIRRYEIRQGFILKSENWSLQIYGTEKTVEAFKEGNLPEEVARIIEHLPVKSRSTLGTALKLSEIAREIKKLYPRVELPNCRSFLQGLRKPPAESLQIKEKAELENIIKGMHSKNPELAALLARSLQPRLVIPIR